MVDIVDPGGRPTLIEETRQTSSFRWDLFSSNPYFEKNAQCCPFYHLVEYWTKVLPSFSVSEHILQAQHVLAPIPNDRPCLRDEQSIKAQKYMEYEFEPETQLLPAGAHLPRKSSSSSPWATTRFVL